MCAQALRWYSKSSRCAPPILPFHPPSASLLVQELFSHYFGGAPLITIPGFTHPVSEIYLEGIIERLHYVAGHEFTKEARAPARLHEEGGGGGGEVERSPLRSGSDGERKRLNAKSASELDPSWFALMFIPLSSGIPFRSLPRV